MGENTVCFGRAAVWRESCICSGVPSNNLPQPPGSKYLRRKVLVHFDDMRNMKDDLMYALVLYRQQTLHQK